MSLEIRVESVWVKTWLENLCLMTYYFQKKFAPSSFWAVGARKSARTQFLAGSTRTVMMHYDVSKKKEEGLVSQTFLEDTVKYY